jgi:hypothetical protein
LDDFQKRTPPVSTARNTIVTPTTTTNNIPGTYHAQCRRQAQTNVASQDLLIRRHARHDDDDVLYAKSSWKLSCCSVIKRESVATMDREIDTLQETMRETRSFRESLVYVRRTSADFDSLDLFSAPSLARRPSRIIHRSTQLISHFHHFSTFGYTLTARKRVSGIKCSCLELDGFLDVFFVCVFPAQLQLCFTDERDALTLRRQHIFRTIPVRFPPV